MGACQNKTQAQEVVQPAQKEVAKPAQPPQKEVAKPVQPAQQEVAEPQEPRLMGSTAVQKGTPFVTKKKYHKDPVIMMCPYFTIAPGQFDAWKKGCDAFYSAAKEADELIFYGMAFNDGGVHIQQGYGSADALLAHLRKADVPMTEALKNSTLEKVEVIGTRRQIRKVKRNMSKIGDCMFQFFQTHPKMQNLRRPTECSGQPGSDRMVTCHVSIEVASVQSVRVLKSKIKSVRSRTMEITGGESFCAAQCSEEKTVKLVSTYDSMDSTMEHLSCVVSHFGVDAMSGLQVHGPDSEMEKLKSLMGKTAGGPEAGVSMLKAALETAAKRAAAEARHAKACAGAASKAMTDGVSDAVKAARDKMASTVEELQNKAEEMAKEVYKNAMKTEGTTKDAAKAFARQAYSQSMDAVHEMRQAADQEATQAYETAMAAGASVENALDRANKAAEAGAKAVHDELHEAADAAQEAAAAAATAVESAGEDTMAAAQEAARSADQQWEACKLTVELGARAVEAQSNEAAKEARRALLSMYDSLKTGAQDVVEAIYKEGSEADEVAKETIATVRDKARAASWAVVISSEHAYLIAVEKAVAAGNEAEAAREAAVKAAERAAQKAHELWKKGEKLAEDAVSRAESMVTEGEKTVAKVWDNTVTYTLDMAVAIRGSLYRGKEWLEGEIQEATDSIAYAESTVVDEVKQELEEAENGVFERIQRWHDRSVEMEVDGLKALADAAEAQADRAERRKRVCC